MADLQQLEIDIQGDETFAELFTGFVILSEAQEMVTKDTWHEVVEIINHAKHHLLRGMIRLHREKGLETVLYQSGRTPAGHSK
jgi:hypothetical protein